MERQAKSGREARAQAASDLGRPLLSRPTSTYPGSGLFDLAIDSKLRGCVIGAARKCKVLQGFTSKLEPFE